MGQSGGPTAVINASLAGVVAAAQASGEFDRILGMRNGVVGALAENFAELSNFSPGDLESLANTPSSALGSCRYKLQPGDPQRIAEMCRRQAVSALLYIGGNDSADSTHQIGQAAADAGLDLRVIGIPKTIDNDLAGTDHSPGYGSAARFLAQVTRETALDTLAMRLTDPVRILEVMGRHAGWLPGAAWLAREWDDDAPHLVYVPERPVPLARMLRDVEDCYRRLGWCVVVLCENQAEPGGKVLGAEGEPRWVDAFGHAYFDSPAQFLAQQIQQRLGVRARFDKPGTIQRMATAYASGVDRAEALLVGKEAVRLACAGRSDVMVALIRDAGEPYRVTVGEVPLAVVANEQKQLPAEFIQATENGLTDAFVRYALPLLGGPLPTFLRL